MQDWTRQPPKELVPFDMPHLMWKTSQWSQWPAMLSLQAFLINEFIFCFHCKGSQLMKIFVFHDYWHFQRKREQAMLKDLLISWAATSVITHLLYTKCTPVILVEENYDQKWDLPEFNRVKEFFAWTRSYSVSNFLSNDVPMIFSLYDPRFG